MEAEARREGRIPANQDQQQQEEESEKSSDWDDWQDPDYIEEQRKALQEFSKKQKEIRQNHGKKKKKKKKSKKGNAAQSLGMEDSHMPGGDGASDGYGDEAD